MPFRTFLNLSAALILLVMPQSAPPERFPTFPEFTCSPDAAYCNRAIEAGLQVTKRYGRGAAFVDIDGDGWDDVFLADTDDRWQPTNYGVSTFFLNQHDGTFKFVPARDLGIDEKDLLSTWNGSFADYDNDGDPDLLLANGGLTGESNLALYENRLAQEGRFVSVTDISGIGSANTMLSKWWGTSWADYDGDGLLDVVVTRVKGTPLLFHNEGGGKFAEVAASMGINILMQDGKNPVWLDYDSDGDPDLYVAGMIQHAFYRNDGGRRFTEVTNAVFQDPLPTLPGWPYGATPLVFAAAAADFNQDGIDDLYLGRWSLQDVVMINNSKGRFKRHSTDWGLRTSLDDRPETGAAFENTMGLGVGDLFDDGFPDVFVGTGNPSRAAPDIVFCNRSGDTFERCTESILSGVHGLWRTRGHGTIFSDFDHDGDTDMLVNLGGHPTFDAEAPNGRISPEWPALFVNQTATSGKTASITLVGTRSNRDAIGARIRVVGSVTRHYVVRSMQGFQSQNSKSQLITLGISNTGRAEIRWPSGTIQTVEVRAGERLTVTEP